MRWMLLALVLLLGLATTAVAQDTADPGDGAPTTVEVEVGEYVLEVNPLAIINSCVVETRVTLDGKWATLTVFGRKEDGVFTELGTFTTRDTGDLQAVGVGNCLEEMGTLD